MNNKEPNRLTKRGLTANHGFLPMVTPKKGVIPIHVSANFDSNDCYFVHMDWEEDEIGTWERVPKTPENRERAIRCSYPGCQEPATSLDHFYPWDTEANRCDEHLGEHPETGDE